ncbi:MAG: GTP cyclohydrolase, FolE2/MptA family [Methanomassiliicoccales archaeon]|nr:GTP cyclohydrolase, FolE2/MptA family [Methanomassiliicoccales archaeon]
MSKSDVQNRHLTNGFKLTRVGVTGVKKPVRVHRGGKDTCLNCDIDVFVDLPSTQRGSHLSRNLEVISEIVEQGVSQPIKGLEVLAADVCRKLLERHDYATYAEVHINADYFLERTLPTGRKSIESYKLVAKASHKRGNGMTKMIGVRVIGMTACPCAMESVDKFVEDIVRDILKAVVERYSDLPDTTEVIVRSESKESIHKHNAMAERITTLGELRRDSE